MKTTTFANLVVMAWLSSSLQAQRDRYPPARNEIANEISLGFTSGNISAQTLFGGHLQMLVRRDDNVSRPFKIIRNVFGLDEPIPPKPIYVGDNLCIVDKRSIPFPLYDRRSCPPHFYCPNANASDPLSFPSMCPPTIECQALRLFSRFCPPQGKYEPIPCPRGNYCPTYLRMEDCPENFYCPLGTVVPIPCTMPFAYCPKGAPKQIFYGGVLFCFIIDLIMIFTYVFFKVARFRRERKRTREEIRRIQGRRVGTIAEATHTKKHASFVTLAVSGNESDAGSDFPFKKSGFFSRRFWFKRLEKVVNRLAVYFPIHYNVPQVKEMDGIKAKQAAHITVNFTDTPTPSLERRYSLANSESNGSNQDDEKTLCPPPPSTLPPSPDKLLDYQGSLSASGTDTDVDASKELQCNNNNQHLPQIDDLLKAYRRAQNNQDLTLHFDFEKLSLTLPSGKTILNGVTGKIVPGKVTVIMGPSGAGKSTFLNVLMGKSTRTGGRLLINGKEVEMHKYKQIIGYVPQDDIMLNELTVRENVAYSAHVRLPRSWTHKEIESFVDAVLHALDLTHISDCLITQVSGGQRKRVNIGMELATCPSAIFLDEPTSGLDATAALKIANTMQKIASDIGITVVAVIHQPRYEIFEQFDDLLLIAPGGLTAYQGPRELSVPYFEKLRFYFESRMNPADVLMDILSGKSRRFEDGRNEFVGYDVGELVSNWEINKTRKIGVLFVNEFDDRSSHGSIDETNYSSGYIAGQSEHRQRTVSYFTAKSLDEGVSLEVKEQNSFSLAFDTKVSEGYSSNGEMIALSHQRLRKACIERGASFIRQLILSHNRSILQQCRKINAFWMEMSVATVSGALMGLAIQNFGGQLYQGVLIKPFFLISPAPQEFIIPILCMIVGCAIGLAGAPAGVKIFSEEREVFYREASAGHNRLAYYFGKNISSTYRFVISSFHFTSLFYLFASPNILFSRMYLLHLLMFYCTYGLSFVVAMVVKRENASMVAVCMMIVTSVLCGFGPTINDMNKWGLGWILDISFARWAAEAWYSEELLVFEGVFEIYYSARVLFGYVLNRFWVDIFVMFSIGIAWRIFGLVLLALVNRQKQR